jgi:hypothetical protein
MSQFDDICVFFFGEAPGVRAVAERFDLRITVIPEVGGFGEAVATIPEALKTDYILTVDYDCHVWERKSTEDLRGQLEEALGLLQRDAADLVRLKHSWLKNSRHHSTSMYSYFYTIDQLSSKWRQSEPLSDSPSWLKKIRRMLHPIRAKRVIGRAVYVEESPHLKFPGYIHKDGNFFIVDSSVFPWTNQPSLISRGFLEKTMAKAIHQPFRMQGCLTPEDFEDALNSKEWRQSHFRIAVAPGMFI